MLLEGAYEKEKKLGGIYRRPPKRAKFLVNAANAVSLMVFMVHISFRYSAQAAEAGKVLGERGKRGVINGFHDSYLLICYSRPPNFRWFLMQKEPHMLARHALA